MNILVRIKIIGTLFVALTIGMQMYPMDPAPGYAIQHNEETHLFEARSCDELSQRIGVLGYALFENQTAFISTLRVEKECRKQGVGSALMQTALAHFTSIGMQKVKLQAVGQGSNAQEREANTKRLYQFYMKFGFGEPDELDYMVREARR